MPEQTEAADIIRAAQESVEPHQLTGGRWLVRDARDGAARVIDLTDEIERDQPNPNRKTGKYAVTDVPSFAAYVAKHGLPESELWGNRDAGTVRAVINAHMGADDISENSESNAGWGDHTITLALRHSDDWKEWNAADSKWFTKADFAEFVEDHLPNFGRPTGSEMLELARSFKATVNVEFGETQHAGGKTTVEYRSTSEAKAGQKGNVQFPDIVALGVYVYDQGQAYELSARIRYRVTDGNLVLGFKLDRPRDVLQRAFDDVVDDVQRKTNRIVWATN